MGLFGLIYRKANDIVRNPCHASGFFLADEGF